MTETATLNYFLFPHMTLSENYFRNLGIFLPRLSVLEITRQASLPPWGKGRFSGWPVLRGQELSPVVSSCIEGYRAFAQVHGGPGGVLGFLSQLVDELDEPRYQLQEELRGKCPPDLAPAQKETIQAALFLEIARELDEKEMEIDSSSAHLNAIELEFRDILGIEDGQSQSAEISLTPPLAPDTNGVLYMLPKRIESWFQMLSLQPVEGIPIFVAFFPEVVEETLEMIRSGCEQKKKEFSTATYRLGPVPRMDSLGRKQFQTLMEAPGMPELLSSCHRELEDFITGTAGGENPAELQGKSRSLQSAFEKLCRKCDVPEGDKASLVVTWVENLSLGDVACFLGASPGFGAGSRPPVFLSITAG